MIQRPTARVGGSDYKFVAKTAPSLSKHLAEVAMTAADNVELAELFTALDDAAVLNTATAAHADAARVAKSAAEGGPIPVEFADDTLVKTAKRGYELATALERPFDIEAEALGDLADSLEARSEVAQNQHARAVKRAEYAFAKAMAEGSIDPHQVSSASDLAHPPLKWFPKGIDANRHYEKGTRILSGEAKRYPHEFEAEDTLFATMVSDICAKHIRRNEDEILAKQAADTTAAKASLVAEFDELVEGFKNG